jgi:V8-like Glu-specific endopeptidase
MTRYPKNTGNVIYAVSTIVYPCRGAYFGYRTCQLKDNQKNQILVFDEWRDQVNRKEDESQNRANDIGCLIIDESFVSPDFDYGYFEILEDTGNARKATIAGFTKDSPGLLTMDGALEQDQSNIGTLRYQMDTFEGMSGSPLYDIRDGIPYLIGVHSYGAFNANSGTQLTDSIKSVLQEFI